MPPSDSSRASAGAAPQGPPANPVNEYPRPPFAPQEQPWPGLASRKLGGLDILVSNAARQHAVKDLAVGGRGGP